MAAGFRIMRPRYPLALPAMAFSSSFFALDTHDGVATLWLNQPDALNALGPDFWADLPRAMGYLAGDASVRAVVLAGRGRAFSAGLDLKAMAPQLLPAASGGSPVAQRRALYATAQRLQAAIQAVADCPKPILAAVHGYCLGGGLDLALACDLRLAAEDAVFSVRETRLAMVADLGALQRLPLLVGPGQAAALAFTGDDVDAHRALRIGLVNDLYPTAEALHAAAHDLARRMAAQSPLAVQGAKAVLRRATAAAERDALDHVALWNAAFLQSDDLAEALAAFAEKRPPVFRGQ